MVNLPSRKLPKSEVGSDFACRTLMDWDPKIDRATQPFLKFDKRHRANSHVTGLPKI